MNGSMEAQVEAQIVAVEDRLRTAMLASDVAVLDELLAPKLIFTNHLGHLLGKEDDLAAYRSGMLKVEDLELSERHVRLNGNAAIVSVRVKLAGTHDGNRVNGDFRFTRVWVLSSQQRWQILAAHACLIT